MKNVITEKNLSEMFFATKQYTTWGILKHFDPWDMFWSEVLRYFWIKIV